MKRLPPELRFPVPSDPRSEGMKPRRRGKPAGSIETAGDIDAYRGIEPKL